MVQRYAAIAVVVCSLSVAQLAEAATYYVGKTNCSNTGPGSATQPFCSVLTGASALKAGDTLLIGAGTYNEKLTLKTSGTAAAKITIDAAPGAKPVLETGVNNEEGIVNLSGRSHVTIRGLTVKNSSYYCMRITNSSNILIEKNVVDGCEHGGIVVDQGSSNVQVLSNDVSNTDKCGEDCGIHEAITISYVKNFLVAWNNVHNGVKEGIDAKDESTDGQIFNNTVANMGQVGIYLNHAQRVRVYGNRVHDNGSSGFLMGVGDYAMNAKITSNNSIFQNESWNNGFNGLEIAIFGSGQINDNSIYNNVFYNNSHYGVQLSDDTDKVNGSIVRNNIVSNDNLGSVVGAARSTSTITHNLFQGGSTEGSNAVTGDPRFANAAGGDFKLQQGSPAIDKGFNMGLPYAGAAPDIGAHEFGLVLPVDRGPLPSGDGRRPGDGQPRGDSDLVWWTEAGTPVYPADGTGLYGSCGCHFGRKPPAILFPALIVTLFVLLALRRRS